MSQSQFKHVPVLDIHKDNFTELYPTLLLAVKSATFIAIDTELSGLGNRRSLVAHSVDDRYRHICGVAKSRAVISLGLSCFKLQESTTSGSSTTQTPFLIQTFNLTLLCTDTYTVEPESLSFLVEHGFDFNKQYSKGIPYYKGPDRPDTHTRNDNMIRSFMSELISSQKPLVLHNGLVDLIFLYQCFYTELPSKLLMFTADLSEIFPGGVFDSKYIAEFHFRMSASFLAYVYRKCQRMNATNQCLGRACVLPGFPPYSAKAGAFIEYRDCALTERFISTLLRPNVVEGEVTTTDAGAYCEIFAAHGNCKNGSSCPLSHNLDRILDDEDIAGEKKRKRKRNKKRKQLVSSGSEDRLSPPTSEGVPDDEDCCMDSSNGAGLSTSGASDDRKDAPDPDPTAAIEFQNRGHRAGFDSFMTGFIMACALCQQRKGEGAGDDGPRKGKNLGDIFDVDQLVDRLTLSGKDVPLQITRSHFTKTSASHNLKMKTITAERTSSS